MDTDIESHLSESKHLLRSLLSVCNPTSADQIIELWIDFMMGLHHGTIDILECLRYVKDSGCIDSSLELLLDDYCQSFEESHELY